MDGKILLLLFAFVGSSMACGCGGGQGGKGGDGKPGTIGGQDGGNGGNGGDAGKCRERNKRSASGHHLTVVPKNFAELDENGDCKISKSEFLDWSNSKNIPIQTAKNLFNIANDNEQDDEISCSQYKDAFSAMGSTVDCGPFCDE